MARFKPVFGLLLKKMREREKIGKLHFARLLSVTPAYTRSIENSRTPPPNFETCEKIADLLHLNDKERWEFYLTAFREKISQKTEKKFITAINRLKKTAGASDLDFGVSPPEIPLLSWQQIKKLIQQPKFSLASIKTDEFVYSNVKGKNVFALRMPDNTMEPLIAKNEIIVIEPNASLKNGDFVLAQNTQSNDIFLRQYKISETNTSLHSPRPRYKNIPLSSEGKNRIIGKIKESIKKFS